MMAFPRFDETAREALQVELQAIAAELGVFRTEDLRPTGIAFHEDWRRVRDRLTTELGTLARRGTLRQRKKAGASTVWIVPDRSGRSAVDGSSRLSKPSGFVGKSGAATAFIGPAGMRVRAAAGLPAGPSQSNVCGCAAPQNVRDFEPQKAPGHYTPVSDRGLGPHSDRPAWPRERLPLLLQLDTIYRADWLVDLQQAAAWWNTRGAGELFSVVVSSHPMDGATGMVSVTIGDTNGGTVMAARLSTSGDFITSAPLRLLDRLELPKEADAERLLAHELGHVLGLAHESERSSVMVADFWPGPALSGAARAFLLERYR